MVRILTIWFMCLITFSGLNAQSEESTIQWISTYPERMAMPDCDWVIDYRCTIAVWKTTKTIRIAETRYSYNYSKTEKYDESRINNFDMNKVVSIRCFPITDHYRVIMWTNSVPNNFTTKDDIFEVNFKDKDAAISTYNALKHLASLWGLKPQLSNTISIENMF